MGLNLKTDSVADVFLMGEIINKYMNDHNLTLLKLTLKHEIDIQNIYDKLHDEINSELKKHVAVVVEVE